MAKFVFKLEVLLRQRKIQEDEKQRKLAQILRHRMIFHNELRTMQQTITQSKQELTDGLVGKVDLSRVSQFARYSGQTRQRAQTLVFRMAELEKYISVAQNDLIEATRARKALELLRDKQFDVWKKQMSKREARQLDEVAVQTYVRENSIRV